MICDACSMRCRHRLDEQQSVMQAGLKAASACRGKMQEGAIYRDVGALKAGCRDV